MLKVWGRRSSFNVQKVLWLVGELGLAHAHVPAGGDFGRLDEPSFRALNPHGRPLLTAGAVNLRHVSRMRCSAIARQTRG